MGNLNRIADRAGTTARMLLQFTAKRLRVSGCINGHVYLHIVIGTQRPLAGKQENPDVYRRDAGASALLCASSSDKQSLLPSVSAARSPADVGGAARAVRAMSESRRRVNGITLCCGRRWGAVRDDTAVAKNTVSGKILKPNELSNSSRDGLYASNEAYRTNNGRTEGPDLGPTTAARGRGAPPTAAVGGVRTTSETEGLTCVSISFELRLNLLDDANLWSRVSSFKVVARLQGESDSCNYPIECASTGSDGGSGAAGGRGEGRALRNYHY
ncbi:hypothetical protein EVAR_59397_1 [Eumeta japonica]|uniref:Uncharacterized protein n=1 Tax=Eumeta variegata TaxID=151549 RepID=A0A4C1YL91_EUMVA|nr:hypothetical protein EVAR_59397_1 [Eumeta japonica]